MSKYRRLVDVLRDEPELVEVDHLERQDGDDESDWILYRVWWRVEDEEE